MGLKAIIVVSTLFCLSNYAFAGPYELSYGGRLTESTGAPIAVQ